MSLAGPPPNPPTSKPQRVLACVLCQRRKVKCDRQYPCANCIKSRSQCVPATLVTRRRRRKFPERELLARIHKYEDLLRQNHIKFEPFSQDPSGRKGPLDAMDDYNSDDDNVETAGADWPSPATTNKSDRVYEAKNLWRALNQVSQDPENDSDSSQDNVNEVVFTRMWDDLSVNNDHLLFGFRNVAVEISTLHPAPAHIFRLWQVYLDNVDSLLKVTHTPSLQGRIVEAVSNMTGINPILEALMFSIYSTAVMSLTSENVQSMFGSLKEDLLSRYQLGCQQALLSCGFSRCDDRDCLTALYLYLVSVRSRTDPRSLSSMLGVAIRIAQHMGIHNEADLAKCTPLEAEFRRRLWWSLVLFDNRIGEMANFKDTKLAPTWDCKIPLNVNDSNLRAEMKEAPSILGAPSEAVFAVVRGELGEILRNSVFYLDFTAPALKPLVKDVLVGHTPESGELETVEKMIENKYLKHCDPANPLQFVVIWTTRAFLAKYSLMEYHSTHSAPAVHQTEAQRDTAIIHALTMLECDTKLISSPLTKRFVWLLELYFPLPGYIQIAQDLRRRPTSNQAKRAWAAMSDNFENRFGAASVTDAGRQFYKHFGTVFLQAWKAREEALKHLGKPPVPPRFILLFRDLEMQIPPNHPNNEHNEPYDITGTSTGGFLVPTDFDSFMYGLENQAIYAETRLEGYPNVPEQTSLDVNANQLDWPLMNWGSLNGPLGQAELHPPIPRQSTSDAGMNQQDSAGASGHW